VYDVAAKPIIDSINLYLYQYLGVLEGFNGTIFAYG
jgi:kinesin family protein 5